MHFDKERFNMTFKLLESSIKKQIKSSMKRVCNSLLKLNINSLHKVDSSLAYTRWCNRYICFQNKNKYYNFILVDKELEADFQHILYEIFQKEKRKLSDLDLTLVENKSKGAYVLEKQATEKQINYASYLMNMVKNEPIQKKTYSMAEIDILIQTLKKQIKS
jgi:hypothetical protein